MNKTLTILVLSAFLTCDMALPAMAAKTTAVSIFVPISIEASATLSNNDLYYGSVEGII